MHVYLCVCVLGAVIQHIAQSILADINIMINIIRMFFMSFASDHMQGHITFSY